MWSKYISALENHFKKKFWEHDENLEYIRIPWIKYWVKGANTNVPTPEPQTDIPVANDLKLKKKIKIPSTEYIFNFFW